MNIDPTCFSTREYVNHRYAELAPHLERFPDGIEDWRSHAARLRVELTKLLGGFPARRGLLNLRMEEPERFDGYTRRYVVFDSEPGVSVPAYLYLPDAPGMHRAVLALHGHGRGKDDVAGVSENEPSWPNVAEHQYDYARRFAERGYVVLAPDARCFGERGRDGMDCGWAFKAALLMGQTLVGWRVWDAFRALDLLQSLPEVDPNRIACVGLSWGGTHTLYTAALDRRVKVAVVSGYFSTFKDVLIDKNSCACQYIPGILKLADLPELIALAAPRPLLIQNGTDDPLYTLEVVKAQFARVKRLYERLGAPEKVDLDLFEGGHRWNGAKAYEWVDRWL
ncbi:MAG: alpha/beta fold hydrolase [Armatimonadetes bacterium]|nr:alpha/beta fold hydrolase [Armatimonadota bacterium]